MLQSTNYQCDLDIVVLRKAGNAHGHKTVVVVLFSHGYLALFLVLLFFFFFFFLLVAAVVVLVVVILMSLFSLETTFQKLVFVLPKAVWILDFGFWILDWIWILGGRSLDFLTSFGFCLRYFHVTPTLVGGLATLIIIDLH